MPGPGGGGHGGGGFSGNFGGGFGGGGHFGRPYRPWGFGFWPGFGLFGGIFGIFMLPFILIMMAVFVGISFIGGAIGAISGGGMTDYNEREFQNYANVEYERAFGEYDAYEDNILLVLLTNEDADEYYFIAWVGDHVKNDVNHLFGNENTALGSALHSSIDTGGYWYSLDTGLEATVEKMTDNVSALGNGDNLDCEEVHNAESVIINYTDFTLNEAEINRALSDFATETGIPMCIVVNDMHDVLGIDYSRMIGGIVIVTILVGIALFIIIRGIIKRKRRKKLNTGGGDDDRYGPNSGYNGGYRYN